MLKSPEEMATILDGIIHDGFIESLRRANAVGATFQWE